MQVSLKRLRIALLASAALLLLVLIGYLGYGRYRALRNWRDYIQNHHGTITATSKGVTTSFTHDTTGYTLSRSDGQRTIFTLHAASGSPEGNNKWRLHDAKMTFYGKRPGDVDYVYSNEVEYDDKQGVAHALGEVHMDIQTPQTLNGGRAKAAAITAPTPDEHAEGANVIHVKTSGLVYSRDLGDAATGELVEFEYGGIHGTSQGADFETGATILHLLASVTADGVVRGSPMHLIAARADLDRNANTADFTLPVLTTWDKNQAPQTARAAHALVSFRTDGSIAAAEANNSVTFTAGTQQLVADHANATFGATSLPQKATFNGNVILTDTNPLKTVHGATSTLVLTFDNLGSLSAADATGNASIAMVDHTNPAHPAGLRRNLNAARVTATFVPVTGSGSKKPASSSGHPHEKSRLSELHATGTAHALGDALTAATPRAPAQLKTTQLAADDLYAEFTASPAHKTSLDTVHGIGHTTLQQDAPGNARQTSTGDNLQMAFAAAPSTPNAPHESERISSAVQTGHVVIHSRPADKPGQTKPPEITTATSDRAAYDGTGEKLTLTGSARVADSSTILLANTVVLDQTTGDAEARGSVQATLLNTGNTTTPNSTLQQPTHVTATSAMLHKAAKTAEFHGTDTLPARLWQGPSQVEAANLLFDDDKRTLAARPANPSALIHAVFAGQQNAGVSHPESKTPAHPPGANDVIRVASQRMDYNDVQREAVFTGEVHIDGNTGSVTSQRAVAFLTPAQPKTKSPTPGPAGAYATPVNGSLDHVVITGDVQLQQPGRHGTGETLLYATATGQYVLTGTPGHPPHVVDTQQGSITGATLLFGDSGSTIIVSGSPATQNGQPTRVHTETDVAH